MNSLLLPLLILALALLCASAVVYFGKRAGQPRAKLRNLAIGFAAGGVLFAAYAWWTDSDLRAVTLFEAVFEGSEGSEVPVVRSAEFAFEHPGVEHRLTVMPKPGFGRNAAQPVRALVRLSTGNGEVLLSEEVEFAVRKETSSRGDVRRVWEDRIFRFRPDRTGPATIEITLSPGIPEVFVRIEDPEKTDGVRAPGY